MLYCVQIGVSDGAATSAVQWRVQVQLRDAVVDGHTDDHRAVPRPGSDIVLGDRLRSAGELPDCSPSSYTNVKGSACDPIVNRTKSVQSTG